MDEETTNSSLFDGLDGDFPKLVIVQPADDLYYPYFSYSRSAVYSSLFISSLFFFVFFILLVAAIIQCKRSTRIPHEEFALIPSGPVPTYMTIVHTHPNDGTATTTFQLYPKKGSTSRYYSDSALYHSEDAPPSYQHMTQDADPPTYQSVQQTPSDRPSTSSQQNAITLVPDPATKRRTTDSSNPFLARSSSDSSMVAANEHQSEVTSSSNPFLKKKSERLGLMSESESFTDDDVFYEVDTCSQHEGQINQSKKDQERKLPESEAVE